MKCYSYVVARDYGFAPNPFGQYCTLSTCKPEIRKKAEVGDWVVGTGSVRCCAHDRLVFAMRVTEKISYNEYWRDPRFLYKRPVLNGSLKQTYGDNIYVQRQSTWHQADSHHSNADGTTNMYNLRKDTKYPYTLASEHFFYFGGQAAQIPARFLRGGLRHICKRGLGHRHNFPDDFVVEFIKWVEDNHRPGYHGDPALFTSFERYDGVS